MEDSQMQEPPDLGMKRSKAGEDLAVRSNKKEVTTEGEVAEKSGKLGENQPSQTARGLLEVKSFFVFILYNFGSGCLFHTCC